jgi:CRP-like cAMP-binding protein
MQLSPQHLELKTSLRLISFLSDSDIEQFILLSPKIKYLKKGEFYIREGETANSAVFVVSGILRSFYTSDKGDEFTYCITFPKTFTSAYSSFISGLPTEENVQAITEAELIVIEKEKIIQLAVGNHQWTHFLKFFAEQQYLELEKRIFQLHKFDAAQRYASLLKHQPELLQHIPLQYLASYLGISQRHLSRIRKQFSF